MHFIRHKECLFFHCLPRNLSLTALTSPPNTYQNIIPAKFFYVPDEHFTFDPTLGISILTLKISQPMYFKVELEGTSGWLSV